jgi:6-pyruvoyltetrahydropterin/6-carboxytetrahydropterin synthase
VEISKTFRFEASHILPKHPGKCSRLHGHSWVLEVAVTGFVDDVTGFVQDYADISKVIDPLIERLDHRHLGTWGNGMVVQHWFNLKEWAVEGLSADFYPSSENLLWWIAGELVPPLPQWSRLRLHETCTSTATLTREEYNRASTTPHTE